MPSVLELSESKELRRDFHAFNLAVWDKVLADPYYQSIDGRVETNGLSEVLMSPPPSPEHGKKQFKVGYHIQNALPEGEVMTEIPLSTSDGVKGIDTAWMSFERLKLQEGKKVFTMAPEICVEVISPSNSKQEMEHKKNLYFEAGALEVWFCTRNGTLTFFQKSDPDLPASSLLVPDMPRQIKTY